MIDRNDAHINLPSMVRDWPLLWKELYEERAAIMEHEGKFPRHLAEQKAEMDIRHQMKTGEQIPLSFSTTENNLL